MRISAIAPLLVALVFISGCINLDGIFPPDAPPAPQEGQNGITQEGQNGTAGQEAAQNESGAENKTNESAFWDNEAPAQANGTWAVNGSDNGAGANETNATAVSGINATALLNGSLQINGSETGNATIEPANENLNIIFADVGHGDATILMANGYTVLIDSGGGEAGGALAQILAQAGARSVDSLAISSWDEGRIGGLREILRRFAVHEAWIGKEVPAGKVYEEARENLEQHEIYTIRPNAGDEILRGGISVKILNPQESEYAENAQANSIVMLVQYGEFCMLLPSAFPQEMEPLIVGKLEMQCPVFKWRNRGEGRSTPSQLYAKVSPKDTIISVGKNEAGLPSPTTIDRINISGAALWRTDVVGSIYVNASKNGSYEIMPANLSAIFQYNRLVG